MPEHMIARELGMTTRMVRYDLDSAVLKIQLAVIWHLTGRDLFRKIEAVRRAAL